MSKYKVLIVSEEYREIEADSAEQAVGKAYQAYITGNIELQAVPSFLCEECDLLTEEEN